MTITTRRANAIMRAKLLDELNRFPPDYAISANMIIRELQDRLLMQADERRNNVPEAEGPHAVSVEFTQGFRAAVEDEEQYLKRLITKIERAKPDEEGI